MEVSGEITVVRPVEETYRALIDPQWVAQAVPGIRQVTAVPTTDPRSVACELQWELGTAMMRVQFSGVVTWRQDEPPRRLELAIRGTGSTGPLDLTLQVILQAQATTTVIRYRGQGEGPEASHWKSKVMEPVARFMVQKLVESLARNGGAPR